MAKQLTHLCIIFLLSNLILLITSESLLEIEKDTDSLSYDYIEIANDTTASDFYKTDSLDTIGTTQNESWIFLGQNNTTTNELTDRFDTSTQLQVDNNISDFAVFVAVGEISTADDEVPLNTTERISTPHSPLSTSESALPTSEPTLPTSQPILPTSQPALPTSHTALSTSQPALPTPLVTPEVEPCPMGCRCTAPLGVEHRHYWNRQLAQYRMRKLMYGYRPTGYGFDSKPIRRKRPHKGREMICVGLKDIPDYVPSDVTKVTIYGKLRETWEYQQDEAYLNDQGFRDDSPDNQMSYTNLNQITSVSKLNVIPSAGMKRLWVEGNRIKVLHPTDFAMLDKIRYLHLRNNRLKQLSLGVFQSLKDIHEIDLSENHLQNELKTTFMGLHQLRKVVLAKNRLTSLHSRTFQDLNNLDYLDVSYNLLSDLPEDILSKSALLRHVDLSYNSLKIVKKQWFLNLFSLEKLLLQGNRFHRIPEHIFAPLSNLTHLNLDKNLIWEITEEAFKGLENLLNLRLQNNNISFIEDGAFLNMSQLTYLRLDNNKLDYISLDLFNGLENLKTLTLSYNRIKGVSRKVFENLPQLEKLDLSHNRVQAIKYRNFFGLLELKILRLDHNEITSIEHEGFAVSPAPNYSKLTWLYLNFNEIGALTGKAFSGLCYLKLLNLGHNKIELIDDHTFTMMNELNTLIMSNNQIPFLHAALFRKLKSLRHMNLGSNLLESLDNDVLFGLDWLEDLGLQNNEISYLNNRVFLDTPKLNSLNLKKNKLTNIDLNILDAAPKLRYLDVSQNHLQDLTLPTFAKWVVNVLSLADNSLETMSAEVMDVIAYMGKLHLYGNPWSCDCGLSWLLAEGRSYDNETGFVQEVVLAEKEEIECKSPSHLSGERILRLDPDDMTCSNETDDFMDNIYEYMFADEATSVPQLGCSPSALHRAHDDSSNQTRYVDEDEPLQWVANIYDEQLHWLCDGVRLGVKHILTATHCWKGLNLNKIIVQFGSTSIPNKWFTAEFGSVEHFEGPLDYTILRIQRPEVQLTTRVFPCLLNNNGLNYAKLKKPEAVIVTSNKMKHRKSKLKSMSTRVITKPCIEDMLCLQFNTGRNNLTGYGTTQLPVFIQVGSSRWALAGFADLKRFGNALVEPIEEMINWAHRFIR